ncbi:hypothetical protein JXA12_03305 [Candidatus Woesearchaeota archaeon]|nr:hypothetical protein [Candidatus Woesearchaeota archaeon]
MADLILNKLAKPARQDLDDDIAWLCDSLGLCNARDTHSMSVQVFKLILQKGGEELTPEMIAKQLNIEHQRALYHIRSLIKAGILIRDKKHIELREGSMTRIIDELQEDANKIFASMRTIAGDVDEELGLENR